jgi:hypothetical protein
MSTTKPDFAVAEEQLLEEGAAFDMGAYGYAEFRGAIVRTASDTLFAELQHAFRFAATAGMMLSPRDIDEDIASMDGEHGRDPEYVAWVRSLPRGSAMVGLAAIMHIVPPWATLGELLQEFLWGAADTAKPGEPQDSLYATPPVKALRDRPVWLQRTESGEWAAFFPEDY